MRRCENWVSIGRQGKKRLRLERIRTMALMEGRLVKLNGVGFKHTVQKTVLKAQKEWMGFVPTHVSVALDEAADFPAVIEVLLANQHKTELTVYGCKTTRKGHVFVCRPQEGK